MSLEQFIEGVEIAKYGALSKLVDGLKRVPSELLKDGASGTRRFGTKL